MTKKESFPPRLFGKKFQDGWAADDISIVRMNNDFEFLSLAEHESLLEAAVNAETARCLVICEEQKREERVRIWEQAWMDIADYDDVAEAVTHLQIMAKAARESK